MLNQRAVESEAAPINVILWDAEEETEARDMLLAELPTAIRLDTICSFADMLAYLTSHDDISLVITVLRPSDLQMLYQIQQLQKEYPGVPIVALVGEVINFANIIKTIKDHYLAKPSHNSGKNVVKDVSGSVPSGSSPGGEQSDCHLTPRQRDVLALLMQGQSNKQIARMLDLSEGTVKIHCMAIFRELGVANRTQAALKAEQIMPELCYS